MVDLWKTMNIAHRAMFVKMGPVLNLNNYPK